DERQIHSIARRTEADALVGTETARAAEHREGWRRAGGRYYVLHVTNGVAGVDLEVVAGTPRDVLDLQGDHTRTAPLVAGMATDFGQGVRSRIASIQEIVRGGDEMRGTRNLEQTPSLVDADVADDIRRTHAAIGVGCCTGRREANRQVVHERTVVHGR